VVTSYLEYLSLYRLSYQMARDLALVSDRPAPAMAYIFAEEEVQIGALRLRVERKIQIGLRLRVEWKRFGKKVKTLFQRIRTVDHYHGMTRLCKVSPRELDSYWQGSRITELSLDGC
jgi:hypothetical protein